MESCSNLCFFFLPYLLLLILSVVSAEVHHHEFIVQEKAVKRLGNTSTIITVNGRFPGPTLEATNGDSLVIKVVNRVKYNVTIHWHGVRQMRNGWADGVTYVTQCPIKYGGTYIYRFNVKDHEGTFWWHAHSPWLRVTVHGALIVYPKKLTSYPYTKPQREVPIILGEWSKNYIKKSQRAIETGGHPVVPDAFLINGLPGDLVDNFGNETTIIPATTGETLLLRFINAAMIAELFVSIAGHTMNVVAVDGSYTKPFSTSYLMLAPGQTTDALILTNHSHGRYYIAANTFNSKSPPLGFLNFTATAILNYNNIIHSKPILPILPSVTNRSAATTFGSNLKSPSQVKIPKPIDVNLFIIISLGIQSGKLTAYMNNISFVAPTTNSILQAAQFGKSGVFTADFPPSPFNRTVRGTRIYKIKYGSTVQIVLQGNGIVAEEEHPVHLHGHSFYVLGLGFGEFVKGRDEGRFNLVDPPKRSTVGVPAGGWVVIRFVADNPGIWFMHCHTEVHIEWGMAMGFWVENGVGEMQSSLPPPTDLPAC